MVEEGVLMKPEPLKGKRVDVIPYRDGTTQPETDEDGHYLLVIDVRSAVNFFLTEEQHKGKLWDEYMRLPKPSEPWSTWLIKKTFEDVVK